MKKELSHVLIPESYLESKSFLIVTEIATTFGLKGLLDIKKEVTKNPELLTILITKRFGKAMLDKLRQPIPDEFQDHKLKHLFFLPFFRLNYVLDLEFDVALAFNPKEHINIMENRRLLQTRLSAITYAPSKEATKALDNTRIYCKSLLQYLHILHTEFSPKDPF